MKTISVIILFLISAATPSFALIGDNEKQIEARYGKAGRDMGARGNVHQMGYVAGGFMILVDYVEGICQREGFANPDTSPLNAGAVQQILKMSAPEGTGWQEGPSAGADRSWRRTDGKAVAIQPANGIFLFIQAPEYVPQK
jgi:hypothetical protein